MAQPGYGAGYGGGGYAGYYGASAYPPGHHYDYNSYYGQQNYDPAYAAWYAQQQQQQPSHVGQAGPGRTAAPPPLPSEAPPPLPTDPVPPSEDKPPPPPAEQQAAGSGTVAPVPPSAAQQPAPAGTAQPQQQYAASAQYASYQYQYPQYPYTYAPYGQHPPSYTTASYQPYSSQQYAGSSANTYASQVNPVSASTHTPTPPAASTPGTAATAATAAAMRPPGADSSNQTRLQVPLPSAHTPAGAAATSGSSGTGAGVGRSQSLEAMRAAAAAVASRLTATQGHQPAYVQVGVATPAAAAAVVPAAAAGHSAADANKDALPTSLQQYVARALSLLGRTNETRLELRTVLRDVIAQHKKAGTLWSTDWDREPLPHLKSQHSSLSGLVISSTGGRQQQQQQVLADHRGGAWDQLGSSTRDTAPGSSKKRHRQHGWDSDRDSSSSDDKGSDEDDYYDYRGGKHHAAGKGRGGRQRQQQQQQVKKGKKGKGQQWKVSHEDAAKHAARGARFGGHQQRNSTLAAYGWEEDGPEGPGSSDGCTFIVGTNTTLEKRYFRLTRAPLPEEVRPQKVLEAALRRLVGTIAAQQDKYLYYNDQFKAMRQDLTVQGIKNAFTVQVYEAHARAALEYGDNAEYNQCQTQLAILYSAGLPGSHAEFAAYRLLYQSVHAAAGEGRKLLGTMKQLLGNKVGHVADSVEVQHALQVREALFSSNVSRFFRLYAAAPRLGRRVMDLAVKPLRWKALNSLVRAHKPGTLPLPFMAAALGFLLKPSAAAAAGGEGSGSAAVAQGCAAATVDEFGQLLMGCSERSCLGDHAPAADEQQGLAACLEWCQAHGALFDDTPDLASCSLLTKDCWNKLFVPEDTTKVAHGDVNLDIRDFLAL